MFTKLKTPLAAVLGIALLAAAFLIFKVNRLASNLKATTHITQSLRRELDQTVKENEEYKQKFKESQTQMDGLNVSLKTSREETATSGQRQGELQKMVDDSDITLKRQDQTISGLETKLTSAQGKLNIQKKQSAGFEEESRNPSATREYAKLMENEWLAAVAKTDEIKKDLDKTLSELSSQNKQKGKMQKEVAVMHYNLAVILTNQHNFPEAVREYEKVVELDPNDADAHYNLAVLYDTEIKDNGKALRHYREYIRIVPDSNEAQEVREWIHDKEIQRA